MLTRIAFTLSARCVDQVRILAAKPALPSPIVAEFVAPPAQLCCRPAVTGGVEPSDRFFFCYRHQRHSFTPQPQLIGAGAQANWPRAFRSTCSTRTFGAACQSMPNS